jgi:hypothetical protein
MKKVMVALIFSVLAATAADREIVTSNITVAAGDTLRIMPGMELLFADHTGLRIEGHLQAIGTKQQPIVFASVNDTAEAATPFDWNGIEIVGNGSVELAYTLITHATFAVTAANTHSITLTECVFKDNAQWHLSIAGEIQTIPEGQPYTRKPPAPELIIPAVELTPQQTAPTPEAAAITTPETVKPSTNDTHRTWRFVLGGAGAATAIGGSISLYQAHRIRQDYNAYVPGNSSFDAATPAERQQHYDELRRAHNVAQILGWSLIGLTAADIVYLMFFF